MFLALFLGFLALLFACIYRLACKIRPNLSGTPYLSRFWGNLGPNPKTPPVPSPEAEAYSKRLLEERRHPNPNNFEYRGPLKEFVRVRRSGE